MNENMQSAIRPLLQRLSKSPGNRFSPPCTMEDIKRLELAVGIDLPPELVTWLMICGGGIVSGKALLGISDQQHLCIEHQMFRFPQWITNHWLPVANDGMGSFFVIAVTDAPKVLRPICFIEEYDINVLDYVAASSLWHFLYFFLSDLENDYWPFDPAYVCEIDPQIVEVRVAPLPWEVDEE